ncbi:helix-turn-helix domain-containing protein [Nocardia cyriacigeorgica]|nr:helix-turn-helix transcriptional regulator [Nocardia cyriacigeorgica]
MAPASPIVARWELMLRLRDRRKELEISPATIAKKLGISSGYWSHIEGERNLLSEDKLRSLLDWFEFDEDEKQELLGLRLTAKERGWWSRYSGMLGPEQLRLIGLEHGAQSLRTFEGVLVPGLLQTERYARALIASTPGNVRPAEVEQRVDVRMQRQRRLDGPDAIHLTAVVGQAALVHRTGGTEVLREQLLSLINLVQKHEENLDLRIIPFESEEGNALGGGTFHLVDFESTKLPTLAWQEAAVSSETSDDDALVRDLSYVYGKAQTMALGRDESLALIERSASQL